ncbi:inactive rhomboid protein 1 [Teleopsis dalmanni]|uniref:inactive rhomboid protein 1 n=1 Tax=Teleopsis dalmanni TaxID=139649 RepID=UPI0018CD48CB|nr:inactive rhomboid protein 1 [Teleopsis dalmanni]
MHSPSSNRTPNDIETDMPYQQQMVCNNRRKLSLNYSNQLLSTPVEVIDCNNTTPNTNGRYSPHTSDLLLRQSTKHSIERYDDALNCCLPPPSPAPNNDHYMTNLATLSTVPESSKPNIKAPSNNSGIDSQQIFPSQSQYDSEPPENVQVADILTQKQHELQQKYVGQKTLPSSNICPSMCYNSSNIKVMNSSYSQKYNNVNTQRSDSPSARYRIPENFREPGAIVNTSDNCSDSKIQNNYAVTTSAVTPLARFASTTYFISQNTTPLQTNDSYTYLSSTVHTPVKRYIPTPPPNEIVSITPTLMSVSMPVSMPVSLPVPMPMPIINGHSKCISNSSSLYTTPHHHSNLPYRVRIKCCPSEEQFSQLQQQQQIMPANINVYEREHRSLCIADGCATSPRMHPTSYMTKCTVASTASTTLSSCKGNIAINEQLQLPTSNAATSTTEVLSTQNAINFSSVNAIESSNLNTTNNSSMCSHCSTVRRTTGVHQTTQTTGPISPIPLQQISSTYNGTSNFPGPICSTANTLVYSAEETKLSPLSSQSISVQPTLLQINITPTEQQNEVQQKHKTKQAQFQQMYGQSKTQNPHIQCLPTQQQRYSRKKRLNIYFRKQIATFFGVDVSTEAEEYEVWQSRHRRLAIRRFGNLKFKNKPIQNNTFNSCNLQISSHTHRINGQNCNYSSDRPDVLPAHTADDDDKQSINCYNIINLNKTAYQYSNVQFQFAENVQRKPSVVAMMLCSVKYIMDTINRHQPRIYHQWSRSFAPPHVNQLQLSEDFNDLRLNLSLLQENEVFFDAPNADQNATSSASMTTQSINNTISPNNGTTSNNRSNNVPVIKTFEIQERQMYVSERVHGWRTTGLIGGSTQLQTDPFETNTHQSSTGNASNHQTFSHMPSQQLQQDSSNIRGHRIIPQLLDGVLENSRRTLPVRIKLYSLNDLDDRTDHRPFFTYWINTVQTLILFLSLICYGIGPIGVGIEQKTGQVLVTSLSLQTVQHTEQRNFWIGPRNNDLVHMGAKFATCMRKDIKIMDVLSKTRRQERETACCIRNDDSGCVQSSQADCSIRGLYPTKSMSTWKKWSPGESGPGGRISGSVCGLDPKFCDAPASIAPYEWPDDITKWPICRKTNSFPQRFRYKDHTAEHMVCEVIGHPCCTGVYGECRITTREYCDFVNGYFHEEASLCSQISCLNNVCGMFPFLTIEVPDQFYRLFTSLYLHAGILHLAITIVFQHIFLADLEHVIGPIRTAIVYIGSGFAGNLTSAVLVPYKTEVGPLASISGVVASLIVLLILIWKQLRKPHIALLKLIFFGSLLFCIGTLPWQLNFTALLAGIFCGVFLTIALVPFVSFTKYERKAKMNLIWTCILSHFLIYAIMIVIFYLFPTELTNFHFGESLNYNSLDITRDSTDTVTSTLLGTSHNFRTLSQQKAFALHHPLKENGPTKTAYLHHQSYMNQNNININDFFQNNFYNYNLPDLTNFNNSNLFKIKKYSTENIYNMSSSYNYQQLIDYFNKNVTVK